MYLPEYGDLSEDDWTGIGFQAKLSSGTSRVGSYIISGGYSGGAATGDNEALSPADLLDRGDVFAGEREGTYHHSATDMTIGTGGMPFGLSLSRAYSSERRLQDGPLGLGWTHNFDISANVKSDSFQALGADSTIDAAAHIVALHVVFDILSRDDDSLTNNVIASLVESWLMDQMMDNVVNIEQGGGKMQFTKVPDANDPNGFYNPPTRTALKLVLNDGKFRLKTPNGIFNDFDSSGIHTLKWVYVKDSSGSSGDDCGWVDFVQWSGPSPQQDPSNWQTINYKHDLYGRRIEKKVDGYSTRYLYDGGNVIAEYDGNNNLLRKYIYGPGIDQPVCMIEVADSNAVYYYHYDGLGSVVALSDSAGDTVQTYEYSIYGQVAVEDANHTNPYMFAGRRFDIEIGQYYNRARYYNPYTGRFLQADPIGYEDGMNLYAYCKNNPLGFVDPTGHFRRLIFRGYNAQQWEDVMDGIFDVALACEQRIDEIDAIHDSPNGLGCETHEPFGPECRRGPALVELRDKLKKIQDMIIGDSYTICFVHKNLDEKRIAARIISNAVSRLFGVYAIQINSGPIYGPWVSGIDQPASRHRMGELLIHEFSHIFGTRDKTGTIDWNKDAEYFDDLFSCTLRETEWYQELEDECLGNEVPHD